MRITYLVLSHTNPAHVAKLVARLLDDDADCRVVVHHDAAHTALDGYGLESHDRVDVVAFERNVRWGSFRIVKATLRSLALVSHATDPDWTVVISGQDYPARPVTDLHAKLRETNADCFVTVRATIDSHRPKVDEGEATYWHARYYYRWYRLPRLASRVRIKGRWRLRRMWARISLAQPFIYVWFLPANGGTMVGFRRRRTPFGPTFQCYAGSQWFAVNRRALRALMDFTARCPDVVRFYARTVIPDESLILSALMNDGSVTTAGPSLTYDRFARSGDAHPELLTIRDLAAIQRSGAFFARKILDPRLVIALDARLDATR